MIKTKILNHNIKRNNNDFDLKRQVLNIKKLSE